MKKKYIIIGFIVIMVLGFILINTQSSDQTIQSTLSQNTSDNQSINKQMQDSKEINKTDIHDYQSTKDFEKKSLDINDDTIHLPSPSNLSKKEDETLVSYFEESRRNWLSIETFSATYEARPFQIWNGVFRESTKPPLMGKIEAKVIPKRSPDKTGIPYLLPVHLYNENYGWHFVKDSIEGSTSDPIMWADNPSSELEDKTFSQIYRVFPLEAMFKPIYIMSRSYKDDLWGKADMTKEQYFSNRVRGSSNDVETQEMFGGKKHYYVQASPKGLEEKLWFNADNGEITQIDPRTSGDVKIESTYDDYAYDENKVCKYPRKISFQWVKGNDEEKDKQKGWGYIIEIGNIFINSGVNEKAFAVLNR